MTGLSKRLRKSRATAAASRSAGGQQAERSVGDGGEGLVGKGGRGVGLAVVRVDAHVLAAEQEVGDGQPRVVARLGVGPGLVGREQGAAQGRLQGWPQPCDILGR